MGLARRRTQQAGVSADLRIGGVARLDRLPPEAVFDLALDIGCFHSLPTASRRAYAGGLRDHMTPGGIYLLYAFGLPKLGWRRVGVSPDEVASLFAYGFLIQEVKTGEDTGSGKTSAWYWLQRV